MEILADQAEQLVNDVLGPIPMNARGEGVDPDVVRRWNELFHETVDRLAHGLGVRTQSWQATRDEEVKDERMA